MKFSAYGHELDYEVLGAGRPIVFLHGLTVDRQILKTACEPICATRPLERIYVDLPGHGRSKANHERASADDLVDVLAAFLDHVCREQAPLLFAYSYGGYLAQGLLRNRSWRGIMLVCPIVEPDFARRDVPARRTIESAEPLEFADDREREGFDEVAVRRTPEVLQAFRRAVHPANLAVDRDYLQSVRARYVMSRPYFQALESFAGPATIVCGRDDHWCGFRDAIALASQLRECHYLVEPGCGHLLPLEAPEEFSRALTRFLDRAG